VLFDDSPQWFGGWLGSVAWKQAKLGFASFASKLGQHGIDRGVLLVVIDLDVKPKPRLNADPREPASR
jgi:hypothetical protein